MRFPVLFITLAIAVHGSANATDDNSGIRLVVNGTARPLLPPGQPRCGPRDLADAGIRVFRRADHSLIAFSNETENYPLVGKDFLHLAKDCQSAFHSAHDPEPAHFNDDRRILRRRRRQNRDRLRESITPKRRSWDRARPRGLLQPASAIQSASVSVSTDWRGGDEPVSARN